jgi:ABC-type transporter Mla subunit MlaD
MIEKTHHFKIGLFVLAAIALLVAGLMAFGARSYFQEKVIFETFVQGDVEGLSVGSLVKLRGVPMGQVKKIGFAWNEYPGSTNAYITVEFEVAKSGTPIRMRADPRAALAFAVTKGLRAIVKSQGITGTSFISLEILDPERNPPPPLDFTPRHYYIPSAASQLTKMLESIEDSLRSFRQLDFGAMNHGITNLLQIVNHFGQKLDELDLKKLTGDADAVIVEFKGVGVKLQDAVQEVRTTLKGMELQTVGTNANRLLVGLQDSNGKLQMVLDRLGTAPLEQTVSDLRQVLRTLNGVLQEMKEYPAGFFLGEPPLPVRGVQAPRK